MMTIAPEPSCAHCGASADNATIVCCASCQCAFYCCEQHQLLDWKRHKSQCKTALARKREQLFEQKQAQAAAASASTTLEENSGNNETSTTNLPGTISEQQKQQPEEAITKIVDAAASKLLPETNNESNDQKKKQRSESVSPSPFKTPFSVLDFRSRAGSASVIANGAATASGDDPCAAANADQQQGTSSRVLGVQGVLEQSCSTASATSAEPCPSQVKLNLRNVIEGLSRKLLAPVDGIEKFDHSLNKPLNLAKNENYMRMVSGLPRNTAFSFHVRRIAEHVGGALNRFGWAVVDSLVGAEAAEEVLKEVKSMNARNMFEDAKLAKGKHEQNIRGDKILWTDGQADKTTPSLAYVCSVLDSVVFACGGNIRKNSKVVGKSKAMISLFPGNGSQYVLHVDNPNRDGRSITVIYNMNKNWQPQDGGLLTLHPISALKSVPIKPVLDRAIFLWSDRRCPYEVEPTYFNRYSLTVWYYDGGEKAETWRRSQEAARQRAAVIQMAKVRRAQKELPHLTRKRVVVDQGPPSVDLKRPRKLFAQNRDGPVLGPEQRVCENCLDHGCRASVRWYRSRRSHANANKRATVDGQNGTSKMEETEAGPSPEGPTVVERPTSLPETAGHNISSSLCFGATTTCSEHAGIDSTVRLPLAGNMEPFHQLTNQASARSNANQSACSANIQLHPSFQQQLITSNLGVFAQTPLDNTQLLAEALEQAAVIAYSARLREAGGLHPQITSPFYTPGVHQEMMTPSPVYFGETFHANQFLSSAILNTVPPPPTWHLSTMIVEALVRWI